MNPEMLPFVPLIVCSAIAAADKLLFDESPAWARGLVIGSIYSMILGAVLTPFGVNVSLLVLISVAMYVAAREEVEI